MSIFKRQLGSLDVLTFVRNLGVTIKAGVPLARALSLFERDAARGPRRTMVEYLRKKVEAGNALADAMESSPRSFPPLVINLVRIGEQGGTLSDSLENIVYHLKKSLELRRKIRNAMMYPSFVVIAVLGLGLSVGTLVLPELIPLFESLDIELPLMTRVLLFAAGFFADYGFIVSGIAITFVVFVVFLARLEWSKPFIHRLYLMVPYIRQVQIQAAVAQVTSTMSTLLKAGIPIHDAIIATSEATSNVIFKNSLATVLPVIESGHTFAYGLRHTKAFPEMVNTLVDVAEETGTLQETLDYLGEYYESEVDYAVKNLTTALEPMLLIGIGIIVGFTVLAIITPIYDVTGSIR